MGMCVLAMIALTIVSISVNLVQKAACVSLILVFCWGGDGFVRERDKLLNRGE